MSESSKHIVIHYCPFTLYLQLAQPIRLLLTYTGTDFEDIRYQRGDGESILVFIAA